MADISTQSCIQDEETLIRAKKAARSLCRQRIAATAPEAFVRWGKHMAHRVLQMPQWKEAKTIFCYVALPTEPDTTLLLQRALEEEKTLCVPLIRSQGIMDAVVLPQMEALSPGAMGILEPADTSAGILLPQQIDLAILPCMAMSENGARLGKGGGFYDRFMAEFSGISVALCPELLLLDGTTLPTGALDRGTDFVVTESRLIDAR